MQLSIEYQSLILLNSFEEVYYYLKKSNHINNFLSLRCIFYLLAHFITHLSFFQIPFNTIVVKMRQSEVSF